MSTSLRLFLLLTFAFLLLTSRERPWADAHVTYATTANLVDHGRLDVQLASGPVWFYAVRNGRRYGVFPLGNVVAMAPSYLAYKALSHASFLPAKPLFAFCAHLSPALLMAGACTLFFTLLRRRDASARAAVGMTLVLAFGTFCFIYARSPYSEALQTLALLWVIERTLAQAEELTVAGLAWLAVACGLMINDKLVNVLLLPLVAAYLIERRWRVGQLGALWRAAPLALLVFAQFAALALWDNWIKTGSLWLSGYQIPHGVFSGDLFAGLYGLLLSSGKGAFFYSPPLLLGLFGLREAYVRRRAETLFLLAIVVTVLLFNAKFRYWHADYCWGPRHLVAITPILLLFAWPWLGGALARGRRRARRWALGILCAAGLGVQLLGATFYWDHYIRVLIAVKDQTGAAGWFHESLSHGHYIPVFSPLLGHVWLLEHLIRRDPDLDRDAPWKQVMPAHADLRDAWARLRVDWWALDWTGERERAAGALLFGLLTGGAALSAESLRRSLAPPRADSYSD